MDYIEAHKICTNFVNIFTKTSKIYYPSSLLNKCGASSKTMVEDAMIIFLAHAILWNELSKQEIDSLRILLLQLDNFVDDALARQHAENLQVIEKASKSILYKITHKSEIAASRQFLAQNSIRLHDSARVDNALVHMLNYKQNVYIPKMETLLQEEPSLSNEEYWRRFLRLIAAFSDEVCNFSGISTKPNDYYLFVSFELMRDWLDDENVGKYYSKYRDYILSYCIRNHCLA